MVVWNITDRPVFISREIKPDPQGFPGAMTIRTVIMPEEGVELEIIGLSPVDPAKTRGLQE